VKRIKQNVKEKKILVTNKPSKNKIN